MARDEEAKLSATGMLGSSRVFTVFTALCTGSSRRTIHTNKSGFTQGISIEIAKTVCTRVRKCEIFFYLSLGNRRPQQIPGEFNATLDNSGTGWDQVTDDHGLDKSTLHT